MSYTTNTNAELLYASTAVGATLASFTTEVQANTTAAMGAQIYLPRGFFQASPTQVGRAIKIVARGILSSTGTPTYTFTVRGGASGAVTGAVLLGSAAIATGSGVTNQYWEMDGDVVLTALGAAGATSTVRGIGRLSSPGFATTLNPVYGGSASPGSVATFDATIDNYINFNIACSVSNAANTITLQQLLVYGLN